jgi:thiol:disulfide interchange protein DsbD
VRFRSVSLAVLALIAAATASGEAQLRVPRADLTPVIETNGAHAGSALRAALQISLEEGFHTNANRPRDPNLIPIELTFDNLPAGISVAEIVYPEPIELRQEGADQPLLVFARDFTIGVLFNVAGNVASGETTVPGNLRYQACDEKACYKPTTVATVWKINVVDAGAPLKALHADVMARIPFGRGDRPGQAGPARPRTSAGTEGRDREGVARLDDFTIAGDPRFGYVGRDEFLQFIHDAENGVKKKGLFEGHGPLAILLIVFLGGLALNLTPCVLPMIPINLAIIGAGSQAGSRNRGFLLGSVYGAAMAFVYGVLGLVVILTAGTFGTINSSPWFNAGIAVLFVVLSLAMFDVIVIDFSRFSSGFTVSDSSRGTLLVAFTMGGIAALLAGACVAPVVVEVVLWSSTLYAAGTTAALALPFVLGVGMAVPWPIAGAGIAALPRPGAWMVRIKQVFGVVILATAVYYGYEAYTLVASRWVDAAEVSASVEALLKEGWQPGLADGLATASREKKPVLIDVWATWCRDCLTMDKTTLRNADVTAALSGYVKIKFQADNLDESPAKELMQRVGTPGLPTYVILKPKL